MYLDYAAATPLSEEALRAMLPYYTDQFYNPSAPYLPAKQVRDAYEDAKNRLAHCIGAKGIDLVITSGATEANNLAFSAVDFLNLPDAKVLVLETEHISVLGLAKKYPHELAKVDKNGVVNLKDLAEKLDGKTVFISIAVANNETGTLQPMNEIAELVKREKQQRLKNGESRPLYFHSDASQALNLMSLNVARLGADLLTLNAAKVYGPKGVGALYVGRRVRLQPIAEGGGQENGLRSGTENVPGVMGFAAAAEQAAAHRAYHLKHYQKLAEVFRRTLTKRFQDALPGREIVFLGSEKHRLANFCPVSFPGLDAERLIYKLEQEGVYLSTGAACSANKGTKSHVLQAMGLPDEVISGSLRVSFGAQNTEEAVREAAARIALAAADEYRRMG